MASWTSSGPSSWSWPSMKTPTASPPRPARAARHLLLCPADAATGAAVVRLRGVRAELRRLGDEAQRLDVELLAHDVGEALDRCPLAARGDDDGLAKRLAHLELRGAARRQPEAHGLTRDRHCR